ncbi:Lipopolysaccharide kinase [Macrophomina phaseolina MS6]|uniref:Lipopolysaccharide kinase n=1 Tax=Macrophomina phaseolina (strain MS6) TaxID=1126212 RepID=K2R9R1_MACPH|nr:Lipopolysaccharide kinase [Macrophomina phaseolina MS6]
MKFLSVFLQRAKVKFPVMPDVQLLQASVDPNDTSELRILVEGRFVKYLTIGPGTYDADDMCFGPSLVALLPPLPSGDWNEGYISRSLKDDQVRFTYVIKAQLPAITHTWHPRFIDHLEIQWGRKLRSNVYEATFRGVSMPIVVKFARFRFEIPQLNSETRAYNWIEGHDIGPAFLGHIVEEGRVIGFAIEHISDAQHAKPEHIDLCRHALARLHHLGIRHGDVNVHNFLVRKGKVTLLDFDVAQPCSDKKLLEEEIRSLEKEIHDDSARGGVVVESSRAV